ncbi:hypothetical protein AXA44_36690 [Rhodococcus sp. SC4]|nr:hypothetical protein AXA44_36690 [Rhodococcus sp. SC4]
MPNAQTASDIDQQNFRRVLGAFPTGVTVITAIADDGTPAGMAVGSFTSVSLNPPLVAFLPAKTSSSFPRIAAAKSYCVNVLGADQETLCRTFAVKGGDKFAGVSWHPAPSGAPIIDGAVAWIDCVHEELVESGDHFIEIGKVTALDTQGSAKPLIFFQGGYGEFSSRSLVAIGNDDLAEQLRLTELVRPQMEGLSEELGVQCLAVGATAEQLVILGSAGHPAGQSFPARIGYRIPLIPPVGGLFAAWKDKAGIDLWLGRRNRGSSPSERERYSSLLATIKGRGWSIALADDAHVRLENAIAALSEPCIDKEADRRVRELTLALTDQYEPENLDPDQECNVRLISAPIFDSEGCVALTLSLWGFPAPTTSSTLAGYLRALTGACAESTRRIGGNAPLDVSVSG